MGSAKPRPVGWELVEQYAKTNKFISDMDFARFMNNVDPSKSVPAWRGVIQRWKGKNPQINYKDTSNEKPSNTTRIKNYFDKKADMYIMFVNNELTTINGSTHRAMKKAYSVDGGGLTIEQMAQEFRLAPNWISEYVKVNGWTHGMDIFTDEQISEHTEEELIGDILRSKRQVVAKKANKKYWDSIRKNAEKLINIEQVWANEFKEIISKENLAPKKVRHVTMAKVKPYAVVLSPTDLHYGKGSWIDETGEGYTLEEARFRLLDRTENLIRRLAGRPEKMIIATGSDWFHVDNEQGTTTAGTPQDMAASPAQILIDGCKLAREHIDMLRTVAPLEVVFMRGNHDRHSSLALMLYLDAVYENAKDVTITVSPKLRQYIKWGNNLLGFTHGDGVRGNDLPAIMATEERSSWGEHEHHVWFHGHLHHQRLLETSGVIIIQLPSLAGHDRYHYRKGFVLARAGISAHLIDKELGLIGNLFAPVI
tara:strand:- start:2691 stop:4130 length:1440 start_codon:yes stop_codon:yes gene_type:complete